jgi:hypothetical protein
LEFTPHLLAIPADPKWWVAGRKKHFRNVYPDCAWLWRSRSIVEAADRAVFDV